MSTKPKAAPAPAGSLALHDIYFILFRHKWVILVTSILGLIAAGFVYRSRPTVYISQAHILINYVEDSRPTAVTPTEHIHEKDVDTGVPGILSTEMTILKSFDLAMIVATNFGPARILAKVDGGSNVTAAAAFVKDNLSVEPQFHSPILHLALSHPDRDLVQPLLRRIIEDYQRRHTELRSANSQTYDALTMKTDALREELHQTEDELLKAKNNENVFNVDDSRRSYIEMQNRGRQEILSAKMELIDRQHRLDKIMELTHSKTNSDVVTNAEAEIPKETLDKYQLTITLLDKQNKKYVDALGEYQPDSTHVKDIKKKIDNYEATKKKMETEEPRLTKLGVGPSGSPTDPNAGDKGLQQQLANEQVQIEGLISKIKAYEAQLAEVHSAATNLDAHSANIKELERKYDLQESIYRYYFRALQQAKIDLEVGSTKTANIQVVEEPVPPMEERSKTPKFMGIAAASGVGAGLVWAFLMELIFDRSVKRPKEIEGDLGLRLLLSIPDISRNGDRKKNRKLLKDAKRAKRLQLTNGDFSVATVNGSGSQLDIAPWDPSHSLHQHYEALRDRLITYFEVNNLNHKPKLVAVAGSSAGTGTTTIAAGLAASLSETGDGNVLLVDMNLEHGSAQHFYQGKPSCELDAALASETRDHAMIQDNLYVVSGPNNGDKLAKMLPNRFANLMPKLKASDYDYIIFDMPPVTRTGVTQRLAGFMDLTLMVVEAEKTHKDIVRQASALLAESKANVSVILNKTRNHIPERLHQEF